MINYCSLEAGTTGPAHQPATAAHPVVGVNFDRFDTQSCHHHSYTPHTRRTDRSSTNIWHIVNAL